MLSIQTDILVPNTLQLHATARYHLAITQIEQLQTLQRSAQWQPIRKLVLGSASNIVLPTYIDALVITMAIKGRTLLSADQDYWLIRAGAGENWHEFVKWTLDEGYAGLENLALIPGTVGAAPIQNIGAYGLEVSEKIQQIEWFDLSTGQHGTLTATEAQFGYRHSLFKTVTWQHRVITAVIFSLPKKWHPILHYGDLTQRFSADVTPHALFDAICDIRRNKLPDPRQIGNVGSFFKNPFISHQQAHALQQQHPPIPIWPQKNGQIKTSAAWLIDQCGWKGRYLGPVGIHAQHALVLVNRGQACQEDIIQCAKAIERDVKNRFGITLEPEPIVYPSSIP